MSELMHLPNEIASEDELDWFLAEPSLPLVENINVLKDGLILLGAGGKLGLTLALMSKRAAEKAGLKIPIFAVSRFSNSVQKERFAKFGIETISCDLLDPKNVERLPDVPNVVFMVGYKFGTTGNEPLTWVINAYLPGVVARRYSESRILVFSTGNVYPFVAVESSGADENTPPNPIGEYAQSCLGRERVFQYFCITQRTPTAIIRLNYAVELRYGVLVDIAKAVWDGQPVDLSMPYVNVIWQSDACDWALRAFSLCSVPATILNVTGPEKVSVRAVAEKFGEIFGRTPKFKGREAPTALLSNSTRACQIFGKPRINLEQMVIWIADWIMRGGILHNKPTHFWEREGRF